MARCFLKGALLPAVAGVVAFLFVFEEPIAAITCLALIVGCLSISLFRSFLLARKGAYKQTAAARDREAVFYWLGMLATSLAAPAPLMGVLTYAANRKHVPPSPPPSAREIELEACPLKFFVDGLPASFSGVVIHDGNKLLLSIPNCDDLPELVIQVPERPAQSARLKHFLDLVAARAARSSSAEGQPWKYSVRASLTGDLTVTSEPPGYRKDYNGDVFDPSGKPVGLYPGNSSVQFSFRLSVSDVSDTTPTPLQSRQ